MKSTPKNDEWAAKWTSKIDGLVSDFMPSGSGIDCGTKFDWDASNPEKIVFSFSFHHMNDGGHYDGWTEHLLVVRPSLAFGLEMKITGRDRNGIKEYLHDVFHSALTDEIEETAAGFVSISRAAAVATYNAKVAAGEIV